MALARWHSQSAKPARIQIGMTNNNRIWAMGSCGMVPPAGTRGALVGAAPVRDGGGGDLPHPRRRPA
ncbi:hypothetical protein STVA_04760 [Allostella vacuolata]|nr:hypothetical protein STVA_04760 [Stella vacuolata]